jgi:hypothetical protein
MQIYPQNLKSGPYHIIIVSTTTAITTTNTEPNLGTLGALVGHLHSIIRRQAPRVALHSGRVHGTPPAIQGRECSVQNTYTLR